MLARPSAADPSPIPKMSFASPKHAQMAVVSGQLSGFCKSEETMVDSKTVVLVADDEPSTLAMVSAHLRTKGFRVLEATDGDQAWELAHEHLPDLIVLDVMMPGMSGWEVCRKIREAVSLAHAGVIMLTGIGDTLNEMTSPLYGADAYVDKPFEFNDLDRKIEDTLARRREGALGRADFDDEDEDADPASGPGLAKAKGSKRGPRQRKAEAAQTELSFITSAAPFVQTIKSAKKAAPKAAKAPAKSTAKPAKVAAKAVKPVAEPAKVAAKAVKPVAKSKEPAQSIAKPAPKSKKPAKLAKPAPKSKKTAKLAKPAPKSKKTAKLAKPAPKSKKTAKLAKPAPKSKKTAKLAKPAPKSKKPAKSAPKKKAKKR